MSIQKKSLISTLKTAKKANVASANTHEAGAKGAKVASMRVVASKAIAQKTLKVQMKSAKITLKAAN
jgi:hypothetical protein